MASIRKGIAPRIALLVLAAAAAALAGEGEKADGERKGRQAPLWEKIFPVDRLLDIHLTLDPADWARLPKRPFEYVPARFECSGVTIARVGLRVKGNSSSGVPNVRKSLKIDLDRYEKDGTFLGITKLNLHNGFKDPTMMRETLAYALFRAAGVPASRTGFARVFITLPGECSRKYLGIYANVEQVNGDFLRDRFEDAGGNLWKGEAGADFSWRGPDPEDYGGYELKRNEDRGDYSRLLGFLRALHEAKGSEVEKVLEAHVDTGALAGYLAANTLLANLDSPAGTGHNYYIYHDPGADRVILIPWDLNEAFGNFRMGSGRDMERLSVGRPYSGEKVLLERFLSVPRFRSAYEAKLKELVAGPFSPAAVSREVDRLHRLIRKAVEEDPLMSYSNEEFRRALEEDLPGRGPGDRHGGVLGLKSFARSRSASVLAQLAGKEEGVVPAGREFRGPPAGSGSVRAGHALHGESMFLLAGDGTLTRVELSTMKEEAQGRLPLAPAEEEGRDPGVEEFLRRFDRDRDRRVSKKEFTGPQQLFQRGDRNGDGFLDPKEIEAVERERRGQGGGSERSVALCPAEEVLAVVGPNTLYAFDAKTLEARGHNRFGAPTGTRFERRGRGGRASGAPAAAVEGDTIWILADETLLRVSLKSLRKKAEADLAPTAGESDPAEWLALLDRDRDGRVSQEEWRDHRAPPERFQFADRNRNGVLEKDELKNLPPAPSGEEDDSEPRLFLERDGLYLARGSKLLRFDRKTLEHLGTAALEGR